MATGNDARLRQRRGANREGDHPDCTDPGLLIRGKEVRGHPVCGRRLKAHRAETPKRRSAS